MQSSAQLEQYMYFRSPLLGRAAPDFTLPSTKGDRVNFTEVRSGKPAVVFFWATWCPHCRTQIRDMDKLASRLDKEGIVTFIVDVEEPRDDVMKYLKRNNLPLNVLLDEGADTALEYGVVGVPTYYLVNSKGVIVSADNGFPADYRNLLNADL